MRSHLICTTACAAVVATLLFSSAIAQAAAINYGDSPVLSSGVQFRSVTESSGTDAVPLYGTPDYFNVGIDFDPASLAAFSANGVNDVTDAQLNFTLDGSNGPTLFAFETVGLSELGDFSLSGLGSADGLVSAAAIIRVSVTEIDGVKVTGAPILLTPSSASVQFNMLANRGLAQPWSLGTSLNVAGQLDAMNIDYTYGATGIEVVIDNELSALGEPGSTARIQKKEFVVSVEGANAAVPEPATFSVLALAAAGVLMRRRAR